MVSKIKPTSESIEQNYENDIASVRQKETSETNIKDKQEFITEQELFL